MSFREIKKVTTLVTELWFFLCFGHICREVPPTHPPIPFIGVRSHELQHTHGLFQITTIDRMQNGSNDPNVFLRLLCSQSQTRLQTTLPLTLEPQPQWLVSG